MIRSHLVGKVLYIASICNNRIISPESINTPPYISFSRTSYRIPPRVYFRHIQIFLSPYIMPIFTSTAIKPRSLKWMESYLSIICLRPGQIDSMVRTVDISTPEDTMSKFAKWMHICRELSIKYEFTLPSFFWFSTIWEVYPEYINNFSSWFIGQYSMSYSPLIRDRISWKTGHELHSMSIRYSRMYPCTSTSIPCFFCRIIICSIWFWSIEVCWEFIRSSLDLLHEDNIWIIGADQILDFRFFLNGSESVNIPGDDFHIIILQLQISRDSLVYLHLDRVSSQYDMQRVGESQLLGMDWVQ